MFLPLQKDFEQHLKLRGVSKKTLRNYRCDLNHFLNWSTRRLNTTNILPYFSPMLVAEYKGYQIKTGVPASTINRRLSTLRNFARFLLIQGYLTSDPTQNLSNVVKERSWQEKMEEVLADFKRHLEGEGVKKATLKNYLSDTRQFLAWHVLEAERALDS